MVGAKYSQTKIDRYFDEITEEASDNKERQEIINTRIKFYSELSSFPKGTPAIDKISAHNRIVGLKIRQVRYEDLFEELMTYMNEEEINNEKEYSEELNKVMSRGNKQKSKLEIMSSTKYNRMLSKLISGLINTSKAKNYFLDKKREKIRPETITRTSKRTGVQEDKIRKLLLSKDEVWRVYQKNEQTIVFKSPYKRKNKTVVVYRDLKGRFAKNPNKI